MAAHEPRLIAYMHGYCATCGRYLWWRDDGWWVAVWSRSAECTGPPVRCQ